MVALARRIVHRIDDLWHRLAVGLRWSMRHLTLRRPHGLNADLVVTLTSFPARFPTLHLTLLALLTQSVRPDRVILWIAYEDAPFLPHRVRALTRWGLEIRTCEDMRFYKKLVPALKAFPRAYLVAADDDHYYWRDWLKGLVEIHRASGHLACYRAHKILETGSKPLPYGRWQANIGPAPAGPDIFPTTGGGVLYPPGSLDKRATHDALFTQLSADADDLWFYFMARMAGRLAVKAGRRRPFRPWIGSQTTALYAANADPHTGNDLKLGRLISAFGWPPRP